MVGGGGYGVVPPTVTFYNETGVVYHINASVPYNSPVAEPDAPTKTGSIFNGWNLTSPSGPSYDFGTPVTKDISLFANWTNNHVLLVFEPAPGTMTVTSGAAYVGKNTLEYEIPVREGYTFSGWNLMASVGGKLLFNNATGTFEPNVLSFTNATGYWIYSSASPLTLYANWTAAAGPDVELPTVTVNLSTGEITEENGSYTGYIYVNAPSDGFGNWSINSFKFEFESTAGLTVSDLRSGNYLDGNWSVFNNSMLIDGFTGDTKWITGQQISIVNFTIDPSAALTGASINLSYVKVNLDNKNGHEYTVTAAVNRTLDADALNTVINNTTVPYVMYTEDKVENSSLFILYNEFADRMDVSYEIEHANNLTTVVDDGKTFFIALNGTGTNNITAKRISDNEAIYTLPVTFAKKADLTSDAVPYSGPASFIYNGASVNATVLSNLSIANHNAYGSRTTGEPDGYPRNFEYTVTYKNSTDQIVAEPTNPGTYTFTVNVIENDDYEAQSLTGYSFIIGNLVLEGIWTTNNLTFSAVNKSTGYMTYTCPEDMYAEGVVLSDSVTPKFVFAQSGKELYLGLNVDLTSAGTNLTAYEDYIYTQPNLRFYPVDNCHPSEENDNGNSSVFYFVGYFLGDTNMNGAVDISDAQFIAKHISDGGFSDGNRLYGMVLSSLTNPDINDARAIAMRDVGLVDEHYHAI